MTNNRFEELEKRCKSIKRRKIIKYVLFIIIFILGCSAIFIIKSYVNKNGQTKIKRMVSVTKVIKKVAPKQDSFSLKLEPVINIPKVIEQPKKTVIKQKQKEQKRVKLDNVIKDNNIQKKQIKPILKIITKDADEETVLLKNYSVNKDFTSVLKLANYYYNNKDYKKALYWAKNANKLDSSKDDSWIIYAKSKYALGQKKDAIDSLETFLNIFYSKKANSLLEKYKKGINK